jgi:alpha-tubulin suppressor-like RCC1 family protein
MDCPSDHFCRSGACVVDAVSVSAGGAHTCVALVGGLAVCWGYNNVGQLGITAPSPTPPTPFTPVTVLNLRGAVAVSAGEAHTCALLTDRTVSCWGSNYLGQLGNGTLTDSNIPVPVLNATGIAAVAAGRTHTCALVSTGGVICFGNNQKGQLGDGTTTNSMMPVAVRNITDAAAVTVGYTHSCALRAGGTVACWGWNGQGQLGNGTTDDTAVPVPVSGLSGVVAIKAGNSSDHMCALLADKTIRCWGYNGWGQVGAGGNSSTAPVTPHGLTGLSVAALAVGANHTCVLLEDRRVACWGANQVGQTGDSFTIGNPTPDPVFVAGLANPKAITASDGHTCVLLEDGGVQCWGGESKGVLGDAANTVSSPAPVFVMRW